MIFKVLRKRFLTELEELNAIVNGKKRTNAPYKLVSLSSLGPDTIVLWCGDVQRFCSAEVLDGGGLVFNLKQFIGVIETFDTQELSIWIEESQITFKTGDRKFQISAGCSTLNLEEFQKEQRLNIKKLKKRQEKAFFELMNKLKIGQEIAYIQDNGDLQTGSIFLGFVNMGGRAMAQVASPDRKVSIIEPEQIGRVFNRQQENPLSRRMI
jgi:hypothetical protein